MLDKKTLLEITVEDLIDLSGDVAAELIRSNTDKDSDTAKFWFETLLLSEFAGRIIDRLAERSKKDPADTGSKQQQV